MAKDNGNGTVTVEKGDNLWNIAAKFLGSGSKCYQIARLNNISNANLIYPGQVLKISETTATASTGAASGNTANAPVIQTIGVQNGTDRTIFATWTWHKHDSTKEYEYEWYYDTGDSLEWFYGGGGTCGTRQQQTFTPAENAKRVKFMVRPIAKSKGGS